MSFESWMIGLSALFVSAGLLYVLATGRTGPSGEKYARKSDPVGYWLRIAALVAISASSIWALSHRAAGDTDFQPMPALFFVPCLLYLVVDSLRSGEVQFLSREPFTRRDRAAVYWTVLAIYLLFLTLFGWTLVDRGFVIAR